MTTQIGKQSQGLSFLAAYRTITASGNTETPTLPVQADQYKVTLEKHTHIKDSELQTYKKVYGASGAAIASFTSYIAMPVGFAAAGAVIGGAVGTFFGGPVGSMLGKIGGGAIGAYIGNKVQDTTLVGRKLLGRLGGMAGELLGLAAKALNIPLRSDRIEETKNYRYDQMLPHLGSTEYSSHPRITGKPADDFISRLQPGDIVIANDEACTKFTLIIAAVDGKAEFNHALLYIGDGKTLESRTVTNGVAEGNLKNVLAQKHHAVAIRPRYEQGKEQAESVIEAARAMIGIPYDYTFRMNDDSLYCSEMVYNAARKGAPQIDFKKRSVITGEVILPGDLLRTSQADVVAEVGKATSLFNSFLAKFV